MFSFNKRSWSGPDESEEEAAAAAAAGTSRLQQVQDQTATRKIWWLARTSSVDDGTYAHAFVCILVVCGGVGVQALRICTNLSRFGGPGDAPHKLAHIIPSKTYGRTLRNLQRFNFV
jgi:hypothetical protein